MLYLKIIATVILSILLIITVIRNFKKFWGNDEEFIRDITVNFLVYCVLPIPIYFAIWL